MKNSVLYSVIVFLFSASVFAQSPIIQDFRNIVKEIPNNFSSLKKELLEENKEGNYKVFNTNLEDSPICKSFIFETQTDIPILILKYDVKNMDNMMFKIFNTMVPQYLNEINEMVKTGNYKGRDYEEEGTSVTELTDLNNQLVLQYRSTTEEHRIMFFGSLKK